MRLIDADALTADIQTTIEESGCVNHEGEILDCIAYADEIDIVYCADCKHYSEYRTKRNKQVMQFCVRMAKDEMEYHVKPDDFCSYGKRTEVKE